MESNKGELAAVVALILSDDFLDDRIINLVHEIIAENSPFRPIDVLFTSSGLLQFVKPITKGTRHLQIMYRAPQNNTPEEITQAVGHWITIYYDGVDLHVYDSLLLNNLSSDQLEFIKVLLPFSPCIRYHTVQRQQNMRDCGVFASAFAVSLTFDEDPEYVDYDVTRMRGHLAELIQRIHFSKFPKVGDVVLSINPISNIQSKKEGAKTTVGCNLEDLSREKYSNKRQRETLNKVNVPVESLDRLSDSGRREPLSSINVSPAKKRGRPCRTQQKVCSKKINELEKNARKKEAEKKRNQRQVVQIKENGPSNTTAQLLNTPLFLDYSETSCYDSEPTSLMATLVFKKRGRPSKTDQTITSKKIAEIEKSARKKEAEKKKNRRKSVSLNTSTQNPTIPLVSNHSERVSHEPTSLTATSPLKKRGRRSKREENICSQKIHELERNARDKEAEKKRKQRKQLQCKERDNSSTHSLTTTSSVSCPSKIDRDYSEPIYPGTTLLPATRGRPSRRGLGMDDRSNKDRISALRSDKVWRETERQKDKESRKVARQDPQYREEERARDAFARSLARKDSDYAAHEAEIRHSKSIQLLSDWERVKSIYFKNINDGYVHACHCCGRLWRELTLKKLPKTHLKEKFGSAFVGSVFFLNPSCEIGLCCSTCSRYINKGVVPNLACSNGLVFPEVPSVLADLTPLEERLVSPRHAFLKIIRKGNGLGFQHGLAGNVINVPVSLDTMVSALPRAYDDNLIITVELRRRMCYKHGRKERVRPNKVLAAAQYLTSCELFKQCGITLTHSVNTDAIAEPDIDQVPCTCHDDLDEEEVNPGGQETCMLDDRDFILTMAPGEGQRPLSLLYDSHLEELAFIKVHCGQKRKFKVSLSHSEIIKSEISRFDRRAVQRPDYLFTALKKLHYCKVRSAIQICLRKKSLRNGVPIIAANVLDNEFLDSKVQHDDGFRVLRGIKNSPAHWEDEKKRVLAMVRQFGVPTLFVTLSAAETRWFQLIKLLKLVVDKEEISLDEAKDLPYVEKARLIQLDPFVCATYFDLKFNEIMKTWKSPAGPFGNFKISHYYYRIESQNRGSPHAHMMLWLEGAPVFNVGDPSTITAVTEFVDTIISCTSDDLDESLLQLQRHRHTHTCHPKPNRSCRFGIPFFPMDETRIFFELDDHFDSKIKEELKKKAEQIKESLETCSRYDSFAFFLQAHKIDLNEYFLIVRSTLTRPCLFLKRAPKDAWINPYSKKILELHQANTDIQFIFDPFACSLYIVNYINKADRGMSKLLRQALEQAREGNKSIRESLRAVANVFLNCSEISAQEAIYSLMRLPVSKASESAIFINTSLPEERVHVLKSIDDLKKIDPSSTDIFLPNLIDYYVNRPDSEEFNLMTLAHFAANFELKRKISKAVTEECENDSFGNENQTVPKHFKLKNNSGWIYRRTKSRVIRFCRYNLLQDPDNFFREKLMLYLPWRDEENELLKVNCMEVYKKKLEEIKNESSKFNCFGGDEDFDLLLGAVNDAEKEDEDALNPSRTYAPLEGFELEEQVRDVEEDIMPGGNPGIATNPDGDICNAVLVAPPKLPEEDFLALTRKLNVEQRSILLHVLSNFQCSTPSFTPFYIFVSGGAGVGKSVLIKSIYQALNRLFDSIPGSNPDDVRVLLTAPTGKAAFGIGGQTLHHAFGLPVSQAGFKMPDLSNSVANTFACKFAHLRLIIIDEISMVGSRMLFLIHRRLQQIFKNDLPFGNIPIVAVGDFKQLPPVGDNWVFQPCNVNPLTTLAGPILWEKFSYFELVKIMRQKDDFQFANALNKMASGEMSCEDISLFESRTFHSLEQLPCEAKGAIHLFASNREVDQHNALVLGTMDATGGAVAEALDFASGDCSESGKNKALQGIASLPTNKTYGLPKAITLRLGARYMITVNLDTGDGLVNGATGILRKIDFGVNKEKGERRPLRLWLEFDDPAIGQAIRSQLKLAAQQLRLPSSWTPLETVRYIVKRWKTSNLQIHRTQFPLVPAEAITIHKSQGATLHNVVVHFGRKVVRSMIYVACSRATSANSLYIVAPEGFKPPTAPLDNNPVVMEINRLKSSGLLTPIYDFLKTPSPKVIQIIFHNVQSLRKHLVDLAVDPVTFATDVILLVETWCKPGVCFSLNGFVIEGQTTGPTPDAMRGFGVLAMVKECLHEFVTNVSNNTLFDSTGRHCEMVCFTITKWSLQIIVIYVSPKCDVRICESLLETIPKLEISGASRSVIAGDFNADIQGPIVQSLIREGYQPVVPPNTITTRRHTCIDHILVRGIDLWDAGVFDTFYSDHRPLWLHIYE